MNEQRADLSANELRAVSEYAALHGPRWKASLREDWMAARAIGILQSLRNTRGPKWLASFKLEAERATAAPTTAADVSGEIVCVSPRDTRFDQSDECSECGTPLRFASVAFFADCGHYCSRRCAVAHAEFLAGCINAERREVRS